MVQKTFSIEEALKFGWGVVEKNFGLILQFILVSLAIFVVDAVFGRIVGPKSGLARIFSWLANSLIALGWSWVALKFYDHKKPQLSNLQDAVFPLVINYLLASIVFGLGVALGFILLIIPGLWVLVTYGLFVYFIVDKKMESLEALKMSARVTEGAKVQIFVFGIFVILVNVLGALAFGIGLLVTVPVTTLAGAHVYRTLLKQTKI